MADTQNKRNIISWVITIVLALGAYYYFIYRKGLEPVYEYYAYFNDVQGLQPSSQVQIHGVRVGKISEIDLDTRKKVKITIALKQNIQLPIGTVASLASGGLTGDKIIDLVPGIGPGALKPGATLKTNLDTTVLPISVRITPMIETAKIILASTDAGLRGFNLILRSGMVRTVTYKIIKMDEKTTGLSVNAANFNLRADGIISNLHDLDSSTKRMSQSDIEGNLKETEKSTATLAKNRIDKNVTSINKNFTSLGNSIRKLNTDTAGFARLTTDNTTYKNATNNLDTMNRSMQDLQRDPPGISIFGGKKKKK